MEIVETRSAGAVTLALKGRLDGTSSQGFEARILQHVDAGDTRLIIDMTDLDYISSVGLRVFILAAKRLKPVNGRIVFCALKPPIKHVFEIAGFSTIFKVAGTRDEAAALVAG